MRCPNDLELQSLFDGELAPSRAGLIQKHASGCPICRQKYAEFGRLTELLHQAFPPESIPMVSNAVSPWLKIRPLTLAAAAVTIVVLAVSSFVYYDHYRWGQNEWNRESELLDQYVAIYNENQQ